MTDTTLELQWLCHLMCDIGVSMVTHILMHYDNKSAIAFIFNPVFRNRTKHIKFDRHITRQEYEKGKITLPYVPSRAQLADLSTKTQLNSFGRFYPNSRCLIHREFVGVITYLYIAI